MNTLALKKEGSLAVVEHGIHWRQLWSLAALYASIIVGWIAYKNYQPKLLMQFGFTDFAFPLMVTQGVILMLTPLVAGKLGDRYRVEKGHRLPIISSGISLAAMVFMAVAFTLLGNPGAVFKWILPVLIILWLISMSVFTSPALSTMELFTPIEKLPTAMAVLTITGNLVHALEPVIVHIIDYVGAPITFILGGAVVFVSGYALKRNSLSLFKVNGKEERNPLQQEASVSAYGFVFFVGLSVGFVSTILFYLFPVMLTQKPDTFFRSEVTYFIVWILILSALISWPVSGIVKRFGTSRSFWVGLALSIVSALGVYFFTSTIVILIVLVIFALAFTSLSVSSLPLAIKRAAYHEKVFCVGLFFSGVAIPEAICEAWLVF
jgi:MFS family permease